ncbi:RCC1 domain-containing protein [Actinoplanes sp. L3-i22]|uniref:RCC1-like domain-containing protein n=1 Tax=Actinoplanes sp. L3-i22 TaxID=2836373 RepID=UPI00351D785C
MGRLVPPGLQRGRAGAHRKAHRCSPDRRAVVRLQLPGGDHPRPAPVAQAPAAGSHHTVGVTAAGRVVAAGSNGHGQGDVAGWTLRPAGGAARPRAAAPATATRPTATAEEAGARPTAPG